MAVTYAGVHRRSVLQGGGAGPPPQPLGSQASLGVWTPAAHHRQWASSYGRWSSQKASTNLGWTGFWGFKWEMEEPRGRPGRDSFPSSSATGSNRFSARWLGPGGGPSPAGTRPGPRTADGRSCSHLARSASRLALGFLILFFRQLFLLFIAARLRPGVLQQLLLDQWEGARSASGPDCVPVASGGFSSRCLLRTEPGPSAVAGTAQARPPAPPLSMSDFALKC